MKTTLALSLLSLMIANQSLAATCKTRVNNAKATIEGMPDRSNGATPEVTPPSISSVDGSSIEDYTGAHFGTQIGSTEGNDLTYTGISTSQFLAYGPVPYRDFEGIRKIFFSAYFEFSTNWSPDGREVCTNHKTKSNGSRVCTAKAIEYYPTSFEVDIVQADTQRVIFEQRFENVNHQTHDKLHFPAIECDGDLKSLEFRIKNLQGGTPSFTVHALHLEAFWNNAQ